MKRILLLIMFVFFGVNMKAQTFDWAKSIGGLGTENVNAVTKNPTGIFITGTFQGTVDFNPSAVVNNLTSIGNTDCFVLKLDFDGNFLWAVSFGGSGVDDVVSIIADNSGIIVAGNFVNTVDFNPEAGVNNSTSNGSTDIFYLKLNNNGNYIYHKTIGSFETQTCSRIAYDRFNIPYLIGSFRGTVDFNPDSGVNDLSTNGGKDGFIMKINPSTGGLIWVKQFVGSGFDSEFNIKNIAFDSLGNIFLGGTFANAVDLDSSSNNQIVISANTTSTEYLSVFLLKLDSDGNYSNHTLLKPSSDINLSDLKIDSQDNIISTGAFSTGVDFNPSTGNNYINPNGVTRTYIWKLTNTFSFGFVGTFSSSIANWSNGLYIDDNDDIYISGQYAATTDFDINSPNVSITNNGSYDAYFAKIKSNTIFGFVKTVGGTDYDLGKSVIIDGSSIYTFGNYKGTVDLNPESAIQNVTSNGDYDFFIQRFTDSSLGTLFFSNTDFQVYPNPVSSIFTIKTESKNFNYTIYSMEGKVIKNGISGDSLCTVDISNLNSGLYIIELEFNGLKSKNKIIKL